MSDPGPFVFIVQEKNTSVWTLNTKTISSNIFSSVNLQNDKPLLADEESTISKGSPGICQAQVQVQTPFPMVQK